MTPEPKTKPSAEELTAARERVEALEAKCALLAASLRKADEALDEAVGLLREMDGCDLTEPDDPLNVAARAFLAKHNGGK